MNINQVFDRGIQTGGPGGNPHEARNRASSQCFISEVQNLQMNAPQLKFRPESIFSSPTGDLCIDLTNNETLVSAVKDFSFYDEAMRASSIVFGSEKHLSAKPDPAMFEIESGKKNFP